MNSKHKNPDFGSYNAHPQDYDTFGYTQVVWDKKRKEKDLGKVAYWGTDERFHDPKKSKIKNVCHVPGPNAYDLKQYWPVKLDAKNKDKFKDKKNIMDRISKGVSRSIYY